MAAYHRTVGAVAGVFDHQMNLAGTNQDRALCLILRVIPAGRLREIFKKRRRQLPWPVPDDELFAKNYGDSAFNFSAGSQCVPAYAGKTCMWKNCVRPKGRKAGDFVGICFVYMTKSQVLVRTFDPSSFARALISLFLATSDWCPWPESNQHSLRNSILSRARLPVPPQGPPESPAKFRAGPCEAGGI